MVYMLMIVPCDIITFQIHSFFYFFNPDTKLFIITKISMVSIYLYIKKFYISDKKIVENKLVPTRRE